MTTTGRRIDWCHDTDSSGRERSYSRGIWPFWAIVWQEAGVWRWQHLPEPGEAGSAATVCADRYEGMDAAQAWFDAQVRRLTEDRP